MLYSYALQPPVSLTTVHPYVCQFCNPDVSQPVHCCLSPWPLPVLNPSCLSWMTAIDLAASLLAPTNPCSPQNLIRLLALQFPARNRIRSKVCLFMAVRGLHCCAPASSGCDKLGLLFSVGLFLQWPERGLFWNLAVGAQASVVQHVGSVVVEHRL